MKGTQMKDIAKLFRKCLIENRPSEAVQNEVVEFTKSFTTIHYSFDEGKQAY
jgi:hypothetical protein